MKKFYIIYKTTCLLNNKFYIGKHETCNLKDGYFGSGLFLKRSIKKYGKQYHRCEILEFVTDRENLVKREKEIVSGDLLKNPLCMNLKKGGNGGGGLWSEIHKKHFVEAGRKAASIINKGNTTLSNNMKNPVWKEKWKKTLPTPSKKTIESMQTKSARKKRIETFRKTRHQQGSKNSMFGKMWITNGLISKTIPKNELIPEGFKKGRILKIQRVTYYREG